jgi:tetratricopeptide (TPR) repeat protein
MHYTSYLEKIAKQPRQSRPSPQQIIAIVLRLADCQARSSQTDMAVKAYHLAENLAAQTQQAKLESVADVNEAALEAKTGKLGDALQLYQHALQLDASIGDNSAQAQDLFAYGHFLEDSGFAARLAYACRVKAESLTRSLPNGAVSVSPNAARRDIEKKLGVEAAAIRRDPEPVLKEAMALQR